MSAQSISMQTPTHRPLPRALPPMASDETAQPQQVRRPPRKKRPKPKNVTNSNNGEGEGMQIENDPNLPKPSGGRPLPDPANQTTNSTEGPTPRRTRRRKKPQSQQQTPDVIPNNYAVAALLNSEDVVPVDKIDEAVELTNLPGYTVAADGIISVPNDKVYVQTTNGFSQHSKSWLHGQNKDPENNDLHNFDGDSNQASYAATQIQQSFMYIALLIHGIFAGMSIWHAVQAFDLQSDGEQAFLVQYQSLAGPTQTTFFIMLITCTVSIFDRYDFGGTNKNIFISLLKFDGMAWGCLFYYTSLMVSIGLSEFDYWLQMGYGIVPTQTLTTTTSSTPSTTAVNMNPERDVSSTITTWLVLVVIRAVTASIGWLIIAFSPKRCDLNFDE